MENSKSEQRRLEVVRDGGHWWTELRNNVESGDEIVIVWSIEDVLSVAPKLSKEQAKRVLQYAKENHDAEIGINWDTLEFWAGIVEDEEVQDES